MEDAPAEIVGLCAYWACERVWPVAVCGATETRPPAADGNDEAAVVHTFRGHLRTLLALRATCKRFYEAMWLPRDTDVFEYLFKNMGWLFERKSYFIERLHLNDAVLAWPADLKRIALIAKLSQPADYALKYVPISVFDPSYWSPSELQRFMDAVVSQLSD